MRFLFSKMFLIILAVLSLVVIAMPEIGMIAAISIIGLPLAVIYWAIPALLFVSIIVRIIYQFLPLPRSSALLVAVVGCGTLLVIPAYFINLSIKSKAQSYVAQDHDDLILPLSAKSIAVRRNFHVNKDRSACEGFCLHALLTGTADKILIVDTKLFDQPIDLNETAQEFSIQKQGSCPSAELKAGYHDLKIKSEAKSKQRQANAVEEMNLRIANGECLIAREAKLGDADIIITEGRLIGNARRAQAAGFSLTTDAVTADRISVHDNFKHNGQVSEIYRWTGVMYSRLGVLLLPAPQFLYGFNMKMGWWRSGGRINIPTKYYEKPDWEGFLTNTLGFNLALDGAKTGERILDKIASVLAEKRPPTQNEWKSFSTYFERIGIGANTNISRQDFDLALEMLQRADFPPIPRPYNLSRFAEKNSSPEELGQLAEAYFLRMKAGQTWSDELGITKDESISRISTGLNALPDEVFKPFFAQLVQLASNPAVQLRGYQTLTKLSLFGDKAVPALLDLIDKGTSGGDKFFRENEFQHPYLAGLGGLCLAGANAKSALPALRSRLASGKLPMFGAYGNLLAATLIRMGEDPEKVWPFYLGKNENLTRKHFDSLIRRSLGTRPQCSL